MSSKRNIQKTSRFSKDLKKLSINIQKEAFEISLLLSNDPFSKNLNIKKLTGFTSIYRVVVFKNYRLIYTFDEINVYLLRISHRKEIYKKFEL